MSTGMERQLRVAENEEGNYEHSNSTKKLRGGVVQDTFIEEVEQRVPDVGGSHAMTTLSLSHEVRHEVAIPEGYDYVPLSMHVSTGPPAREYPFTLDPFQRLAVTCLERHESVLVSAHTSAGKTVVAEYAIAMALRDKQRVIYTSPIKALSNQKYRELQEIFGDVGLMTGDVTINQTASCLVMTTEILRSMLYRGSEVMREVAWVVFDEIHYMRDKERGVVWEETLIMLPDVVRFVFLSATIPNAKQFARWICYLHSQPCHVVYTNYRPTPLQHYLYPSGANGLYLVVDEKGVFREDNFEKALGVFASKDETTQGMDILGGKQKGRRKTPIKGAESELYKIVKMIAANNYHPIIVFSFSKRDCESYAMQMSKLDFNTEEEKRLLIKVFNNAIESLSEEDRGLPQIESIVPLLKRGVGIHHGGLLPILKEVIEILFQEGLIKVLFATETFSIGLNMPAKTVVFTSARKFDGKDFRWISSGEYIQMSGRAGRRGLDDRGIVALMLDERMDPTVAKNMIKGQADALNSAFHLGYNMILNLMRVDGSSPEFMLERSFFQFQNADSIPDLKRSLEAIEGRRDAIIIPEEQRVAEYYSIKQQLEQCRTDFRKVVNHQSYSLPFLQPGRLVRVRDGDADFGWGTIINVQRRGGNGNAMPQSRNRASPPQYIVDVLIACLKPADPASQSTPKPAIPGLPSEPQVIPMVLSVMDGLSTIRLHLPRDLKQLDARLSVQRSMLEVQRRFPEGIPLLDPIQDMKITDESFRKLVNRREALEKSMHAHPMHDGHAQAFALYEEKMQLEREMAKINDQIYHANNVLQMEELKARRRVLRNLGFTTREDVIEMKGRVACEISTGDELLLTELMFSGAFCDLPSEQIVALLSCFVCEEKSEESVKLRDELIGPLRMMQETARHIAKVSKECRFSVDEEEYVQRFRPELMDVVYAWCRGVKFAKLCGMTEVFEGNIIRCLRRLEELLRQMSQAAKSIGNDQLESKFNEGIAKMKRDIVFANSLYL